MQISCEILGTWGYPERRNFVSGTDIYHHTKFHADWDHRHRDICDGTDIKIRMITANLISDKTHRPTSVAFVDNNKIICSAGHNKRTRPRNWNIVVCSQSRLGLTFFRSRVGGEYNIDSSAFCSL